MPINLSFRILPTMSDPPGTPVWRMFLTLAALWAGLGWPLEGRAQSDQAIPGSSSAVSVAETVEATRALTLAQAVGIALEQNRLLGAVRFDREGAKQAIREAASAFWPQLSFQGTYRKSDSERYEMSTPQLPPDSPLKDLFNFSDLGFTGSNYENFIQLSQLIFDRSVIGQIKLANLQEEAAVWQTTGQEQAVVFQTVVAYLTVLQARELLQVQKQRLELAEKQLNTAQTNFDVGLRIRTDVLRAELTRSSAMRDVVSAEIALKNALVRLNQVLGLPIDQPIQVEGGALETYNPAPDILDRIRDSQRLFALAVENHPSIQVAGLLVQQSEETVHMARGEFYPRLSAGGRYGFNESQFDFDKEEWAIQAQVQIPIFEGFRKIAKVNRSKARLSAERQRYENTQRSVFTEVEEAALKLQEEQRNLEIAAKAELVAVENHQRFLNLYQEGLADSLDVTAALTELVEAQNNVVTTRYGFLARYAQLLSALGIIPTQEDVYATNDWLATLP
ncbi:MAG TPA: TolC family protein [bacterium]|nr:TolC family protein [Candidatus Omnitrophota bacterium]HOJ60035.1 TolC family protein [bacterium]HOL92997.1 TolC family protein [bacterium]HPO99266.1 TolC family protein [bacterium]